MLDLWSAPVSGVLKLLGLLFMGGLLSGWVRAGLGPSGMLRCLIIELCTLFCATELPLLLVANDVGPPAV